MQTSLVFVVSSVSERPVSLSFIRFDFLPNCTRAQEERLRAHRRTQEKEFVWKPPPPKVIPKTNKWETNTLSMDSPAAGGGDRGTSGEGKAEEATELFWE